ncbi:hypothetical protein ACQJBY_025291 [Aegilops geniculata]
MADPLAAGNATNGDAVRAGFSVRRLSDAGWCSEWRPPEASAPTLRRGTSASGRGTWTQANTGSWRSSSPAGLHFVESAAAASPIDVLFLFLLRSIFFTQTSIKVGDQEIDRFEVLSMPILSYA